MFQLTKHQVTSTFVVFVLVNSNGSYCFFYTIAYCGLAHHKAYLYHQTSYGEINT